MSEIWLIEYEAGNFINGLMVDWVKFGEDGIHFTLHADSESIYLVDKPNEEIFINHLSALNKNISDLPNEKYNKEK